MFLGHYIYSFSRRDLQMRNTTSNSSEAQVLELKSFNIVQFSKKVAYKNHKRGLYDWSLLFSIVIAWNRATSTFFYISYICSTEERNSNRFDKRYTPDGMAGSSHQYKLWIFKNHLPSKSACTQKSTCLFSQTVSPWKYSVERHFYVLSRDFRIMENLRALFPWVL